MSTGTGSDSWSTQQLTVLLASISAATESLDAMFTALEFAVASVDAEVGAVVQGDSLKTCIGFRAGREPLDQLLDVAEGRQNGIKTDEVNVDHTFVVPMNVEDDQFSVVIGRWGETSFSNEEKSLLRGMVRVLALTLRSLGNLNRERLLRETSELQAAENARLLSELQERQSVLESLATIQRLITSRAPLEEILNEIVERALEHLAADRVLLAMSDPETGECSIKIASHNIDEWSQWSGTKSELDSLELGAHKIEVPVQESGQVVGTLIASRAEDADAFDESDQEYALALAEHVSIVLTDVSTVNEVHRARQDPLTGFPNRSLFLQHVDTALAANVANSSVGVLFIDLDGFKRVNDTLGHAAGDLVLAAVADRLRHAVRSNDLVGRIGGDEFSLLAQSFDGSIETLSSLAQRIVQSIKRPFRIYGRDVFIGASIGIALNDAGVADSEDLLRRADVAMYRAKAERSGSLLFQEEMHDQLMEALEIEADLQTSLESGHFELNYQPVMSASDRTLVGFEGLIRWNHPRLGRLSPDAFIPHAEKAGWINIIDNWVVDEACRQAGEWKREFHAEPSMGVNISGHGIVQDTFVQRVREALETNDLQPSSLILELTETVLIKDLDAVALRLEELRKLGVRLAIDDFGTGYSSLTHLYRFPFNIIKIDRSFVSGLTEDSTRAGLVRAVIGLGAELGLETVAEGVETEAELEMLSSAGCALAQGYLFDKPLSAQNATTLVRIDAQQLV